MKYPNDKAAGVVQTPAAAKKILKPESGPSVAIRNTRRNPARSLTGISGKPIIRAAWESLAERFGPGHPLRKGRIALDGRSYDFELRVDLSIVVLDPADGAIVAVSPPLIAMEAPR
mgnify:FL=1